MNIKIGVIGCGRHAQANIYPSLKILNVPIRAICALHLEHAQLVADKFNAKVAYDDYKVMIKKEKLDAVFVIAKGDQQAQIVKDCLRLGTHVFVEKPLGMVLKDAKEISELSAQLKRHVMVGFMNRFAPSYLLAQKSINDHKTFGDIIASSGIYTVRSFGTDVGSFIKYAAIHYLDLLRFLLGEIKDIRGFLRTTDDGVAIEFSFVTENDVIGSMFFAGLPAWAHHQEEITITGSKGYAKVDNRQQVIKHYLSLPPQTGMSWQGMYEEDVVVHTDSSSSAGGHQALYLNGYVGEIEHFLDCVEKDIEPSSSAQDNLKTMELCEKLLKSLQKIE